MSNSLDTLLQDARGLSGPQTVDPSSVDIGGVDPLGLRPINFALMDKVLPGLNNVAGRIRPYFLMAWAWRRARSIVEREGLSGEVSIVLRDFVDRVEAIYVWSQFLRDSNSELPGGQAIRELLHASSYTFGGEEWEKRRNMRRTSTGLISPLNYGPSLKSMNWVRPTAESPNVFAHNADLDPALDEFERPMANELGHPAFNSFGPVTVSRTDATRWGELWSLDAPSSLERDLAFRLLAGPDAPSERQAGIYLIRSAFATAGGYDENALRYVMAQTDREDGVQFVDTKAASMAWRRTQVRQVFRLALEGMLHWIVRALSSGPLTTDALVRLFFQEAIGCEEPEPLIASAWLLSVDAHPNPVEHLRELGEGLQVTAPENLPWAIIGSLAFCLREVDNAAGTTQPDDRLPLTRARREAEAWYSLSPTRFLANVVEIWVFAQHAYWSVGRAIADAQSNSKTILRLKVVMDEGGWTLTSGAGSGNPPQATADRLASAMSLLRDCGRLP